VEPADLEDGWPFDRGVHDEIVAPLGTRRHAAWR
jgi:hypothetical protein